MFGSSQGGHVVVAVSNILSQKNESHLLKVAIADIPAIHNCWLTYKDSELYPHNIWARDGNVEV